MNTAVKSHFRASNNAAIKTREVRQKISSQWGSLNVHLQGITRQNVFFQPTTRMMICEGACAHAHMRCAVARVRAKRLLKYVCVRAGTFRLVTHHTRATTLDNLKIC